MNKYKYGDTAILLSWLLVGGYFANSLGDPSLTYLSLIAGILMQIKTKLP